MGLKNNPNRDNSIGKEERLLENSSLSCTVIGCNSNRYGYSKYCLEHKNHIAKTGDINQEYINQLKTRLKSYIKEVLKYLEANLEDKLIAKTLDDAKHLLKYKHSINDVNIGSEFNTLFGTNSSHLSAKLLDKLHSFRGDEKLLVAVVASMFIYQQENPNILNTGAPLFFHLGKLIYSYTEYDVVVSKTLKKYKKIKILSRNQYLSIGVRFYSKFQPFISTLKSLHNAQEAQSDTKILPQVKKSFLELLTQEKQERIDYVLEQQKANKMITDAMVKREIENITNHFDKLIQEEKVKGKN